MVATTTPQPARPDPLSPAEADAMTALRARERVLAASDVNARCHALVAAARELNERVILFLEDVTLDAARAVLKDAGLDDPGASCRFGSNVFATTIRETRDFARHLDEYLCLAGCDLPAIPAEGR